MLIIFYSLAPWDFGPSIRKLVSFQIVWPVQSFVVCHGCCDCHAKGKLCFAHCSVWDMDSFYNHFMAYCMLVDVKFYVAQKVIQMQHGLQTARGRCFVKKFVQHLTGFFTSVWFSQAAYFRIGSKSVIKLWWIFWTTRYRRCVR